MKLEKENVHFWYSYTRKVNKPRRPEHPDTPRIRLAASDRACVSVSLVVMAFCLWLAFMVFDAKADDYSIGTILASNHFFTDNDYNEEQFPSLYFGVNGWTAGFYTHSYADWTSGDDDYAYFFFKEFGVMETKYARGSFAFGVVTNYPRESDVTSTDPDADYSKSDTMPWLTYNISWGPAKVFVVPTGGVMGFGLEHRWSTK